VPRQTRRQEALDAHFNQHHPGQQGCPVDGCAKATFRYASKSTFESHVRKVHPERAEEIMPDRRRLLIQQASVAASVSGPNAVSEAWDMVKRGLQPLSRCLAAVAPPGSGIDATGSIQAVQPAPLPPLLSHNITPNIYACVCGARLTTSKKMDEHRASCPRVPCVCENCTKGQYALCTKPNAKRQGKKKGPTKGGDKSSGRNSRSKERPDKDNAAAETQGANTASSCATSPVKKKTRPNTKDKENYEN